jgi:hypothetical protein
MSVFSSLMYNDHPWDLKNLVLCRGLSEKDQL